MGGPELHLQLLRSAQKSFDLPKHHLCWFLPPQALSGCSLHCVLSAYLPGVHGGQRGGVFHCAAQQKHAHGHQPVYSQPRHQWPACRHLLHADHTGGQRHNRWHVLSFPIFKALKHMEIQNFTLECYWSTLQDVFTCDLFFNAKIEKGQ